MSGGYDDIVCQLKRIADSLEIIAGNPKVLKATAEQLKEVEFKCVVDAPALGMGSHQDIVDEWNRELVPLGIPKITSISNNRARMVAARIKEHGKESFHQCIEEVKQSSFLLGKTPKPWTKFNFDWMICPSNFPKVLEGNYNDNRSSYGSSTGYTGGLPESWAR